MNKPRMKILCALMISCVCAVAASAQDDAAVKKELEAQYKKLSEAH